MINHRPLIPLVLLILITLVLLNIYTSLSLNNGGDTEAHSFLPPQSDFRVKSLASGNTTIILSLLNFTINTTSPQNSGRLAPQRRNGTPFISLTKHQNNGDHWWSYTDSCFAVDDICRIPNNRWFYFRHNSVDPKHSNRSVTIKWQPSFELKYMPHTYQRGVYADTRIQMNVHASHRVILDELEQTDQCRMSSDPHHVVLQSLFNVSSKRNVYLYPIPRIEDRSYLNAFFFAFQDMVGEFYSRTLMYMHRLFSVTPSLKKVYESMNMTMMEKNQSPIERSQYYIHITIANKALLDAHKLLLSGMHHFNNTQSKWAKSAVDLLWPENDSDCQCYQKLVFCGYGTYLQENGGSEQYTLWPSKYIDETGDEIEGPSACNPVSPLFTLNPNECQEFAKLKSYVLSNIEANYPDIEKAIRQHRRSILMKLHQKIDKNYNGDTRDWSIVGLTQRYSRRVWLNLQNVTEACNAYFQNEKVVCIEVNVEGTHSPREQFLLHRSLDALVGVHGAQLTQAVFLQQHGHVLELLPWIPVSMIINVNNVAILGWLFIDYCIFPLFRITFKGDGQHEHQGQLHWELFFITLISIIMGIA